MKKSFNLVQNELLESATNMGLDWCKVIPIVNWYVSDNYLIFGRIIEWYYYPFDLSQVDQEYKEPCKELEKFSLVDCIQEHLSVTNNTQVSVRQTVWS